MAMDFTITPTEKCRVELLETDREEQPCGLGADVDDAMFHVIRLGLGEFDRDEFWLVQRRSSWRQAPGGRGLGASAANARRGARHGHAGAKGKA